MKFDKKIKTKNNKLTFKNNFVLLFFLFCKGRDVDLSSFGGSFNNFTIMCRSIGFLSFTYSSKELEVCSEIST